jgi:hypothetical protein
VYEALREHVSLDVTSRLSAATSHHLLTLECAIAAKGWGVVALTVIVLGGWASFRDAPPRAQSPAAVAGQDTRPQPVPARGPAPADSWTPPTTTVSPIPEYSSSTGDSRVIAEATKPTRPAKQVGKEARKAGKKVGKKAVKKAKVAICRHSIFC